MRILRTLLLMWLCWAVPGVGMASVLMSIVPCEKMMGMKISPTVVSSAESSVEKKQENAWPDMAAHDCCPSKTMGTDVSESSIDHDNEATQDGTKQCNACDACGSFPVAMPILLLSLDATLPALISAKALSLFSFDGVAIWRPPV